MSDSQTYQAYLLRLQRDSGETQWRCRLENVTTGEICQFGDEQVLFAYLWQAVRMDMDVTSPATKRYTSNTNQHD